MRRVYLIARDAYSTGFRVMAEATEEAATKGPNEVIRCRLTSALPRVEKRLVIQLLEIKVLSSHWFQT